MPWWGAVLIAVGATTAGFAIDAASGNRELTNAFAALYVIGCIAAVLAVRQSAIFTAVVQPPLILFIAVPGSYYLLHQSDIQGIKDILINCGYPLIERFLLMFTTSVIVLLLGMARWYFGASARTATTKRAKSTAKPAAAVALLTAVKVKLSALTATRPRTEGGESRKHAVDRTATAQRPSRSQRPTARPAPARSRHARPTVDTADPVGTPPPRRRRPTHARDLDEVLENLDAPPPPRRRPRPPREPGRRTPPPEYRREPRQREQPRDPAERPRPTRRPDRYDTYPPQADPQDAPPPRRRPAAGGTGTHHPVSRVRYRASDAQDTGNTEDGRFRSQPRARHGLDDRRYD